jgi:hypothetical protein
MSIKILGPVDKLVSNDERVVQLSGDTDGIIASFYDKTNNPSLFLDGTSARLGNVGVKTTVPNEALTVVGNISASGNLTVSTLYGNGSALHVGTNLIPTTSAFYIGDPSNPVGGIYLAANTLYISSSIAGISGLELSNIDNVLTVTKGGLRSTNIYTGGLLLSGNNIGADPLVGPLPMTIGTNGLPAVEFLVPIKLQSTTGTPNVSGNASFTGSISAVSLTLSDGLTAHNSTFLGTISSSSFIYGDASHLINVPNIFDQSLNTTNNVSFSSLSLTDRLTAHNTTIIGDVSCTGRIYAADVHAPLSVTDLTLSTKTLALSDVNSIITGSGTADMNIYVPANSAVPFPVGTEIKFIQLGTKKIIMNANAGVDLANRSNQFKTSGQHAVCWLFQVATNQWIFAGDTSP